MLLNSADVINVLVADKWKYVHVFEHQPKIKEESCEKCLKSKLIVAVATFAIKMYN